MSQENVELVREIYADAGGLTAGAGGRMAADAEFDFSAAYPDRPVLTGLDALRDFRDNGPWSGSPIHFEPERFIDVDDERVLIFVRVSATGRDSGAPVNIPVAHEITVRDRQVVKFKVYLDRDEALVAAEEQPR